MVRAQAGPVYNSRLLDSEILTTLAFWLRSSVVSVLNSLTTIMGAPPPFIWLSNFCCLCSFWALLATLGRDDLAATLLACVVGGLSLIFPVLSAGDCCCNSPSGDGT
jgi:hypothetical protein